MKAEIPHDPRDAAWSRLAEVAAEARRQLPAAEQAPFGFSTRVVAQWKEMRRDERIRLLQRWSLRAAFCSMGLLVIVALWAHWAGREPASLEVPELNLSVP